MQLHIESQALKFWNDPERVEQFASREPDLRLKEWIEAADDPSHTRVLDIGCAGGRNTDYLVRKGVDVFAIDFSPAMIERTRGRIAGLVGTDEARSRAVVASMDNLSRWPDAHFDLVIALGVFQQAGSEAMWDRTLLETTRVLVPDGECLVANFAPGTGPIDSPPEKISGTRFLHQGFKFGKGCLLTLEQLDAEFQRHGFDPAIPTRLVEKEADGRQRNTVNGLYRKRP